MAKERKRLWVAENQKSYWENLHARETRANTLHDGDEVAAKIDEILTSLAEDENDVLELLLLKQMASAISLQDAPVLKRLQSHGLLQPRLGVGSMLLSHTQTCYSVPRAVWSALRDRRSHFIDEDIHANQLEDRVTLLMSRFDNAIRPLDVEQMPRVTNSPAPHDK